ncbi:MAG: hypothetical protein V2J55_19110 [Candidatus Competibacteraceae bacterium]|jgi:hypothetical protein|nr:hypothetical protein [Candidatus Competibacteraceae bacterium]
MGCDQDRKLLTTAVIAALAASGSAVADNNESRQNLTSNISISGPPGTIPPPSEPKDEGEYRAGDFHNHTTCSDGSTSVRTLTREALARHDWFIHVGHSGRGPRDCRVSDFLYHSFGGGSGVGLWTNTLSAEEGEEIKGDERLRDITITNYDGSEVTQTVQDMWRWQSLQEFNLGGILDEREFPGNDDKVAFLGLEWVVPGHEHASNSIITGQYDPEPRSDALAQFEYCFARNSDDTSQGGGQGWTCEISAANNNKLKQLFANRPEEGTADYNSTLVDGINIEDTGEHVKSVAAILWMEEKFPGEGFFVQAHVERQGAYLPGQNRGWNVEHMRDANTLVPDASIGFESQPGHQAQPNRGSYSGGRPTAGFWTYGGTGAYAAAEVSKPGLDFNGNPINPATTPECQNSEVDCSNIPRTVLSRPGIRTMWDALLSEGRRFWFFGSSDWHNRGSFGPLDFESDNDFWPGEYQDNFTYVIDNNPDNPAKDIVDSLRSGNTFVVQGQLIDKMEFTACSGSDCATMGETLKVRAGALVRVTLELRDPEGPNRSPYKFNNPILLQIGTEQPINQPELAHVELITGRVFGMIPPTSPEYYNPLAPESTKIARQWTLPILGSRENKRLTYNFRVEGDSYIRARGSNLPPGTPHARDMDGNPLADNLKDNIACNDPLCPPHVEGIVDKDLEAWSDIWFYSNPIFIEVL